MASGISTAERPRTESSHYDEQACREYAQALDNDPFHLPATIPNFGELSETIEGILELIRDKDTTKQFIKNHINTCKKKVPAFAALFEKQTRQGGKTEADKDESIVPPLPESAYLAPDRSRGACQWIDDYVAFSKHWSPRSFGNFHEACGWSILSGVALHRVVLEHLGSLRYTPFLIATAADSSIWVKTEAAKIYYALLRKAELQWMFASNSMTPQAMIGDMATVSALSKEYYEALSEEEIVVLKRTLAFKGQRLWFYEEFGQQMDAMMQKSGNVMADFKGIIRRMDDCYADYTRDTVSHGKQLVEFPYLSLLACLTPLDLKPYAGSDSPLWRDGFFARFAFIVPDEKNRNRDRFPSGNMEASIPDSLTDPIKQWNTKLGQRPVSIDPVCKENNKKEQEAIKYNVTYGDFPQRVCTLGPGVENAFYNYNNALLDMVEEHHLELFAGNYSRLHMIALRISMLAASLENKGRIEMCHWAKGQEFAEKARAGLHALWSRLQENSYAQEATRLDEEIIQYLSEKETWLTVRLITKNKFKNYTGEDFTPKLDNLVNSGDLIKKREGRAQYYTVQGKADRPLPEKNTTEAAK